MPCIDVVNEVVIERTPRILQLEGMFDLPVSKVSRFSLTAKLPLEDQKWSIGLITGPSGSGKSSLIRQLWPDNIVEEYEWSKTRSVVDSFDKTISIKRIVQMMSSVGFSSPPAWLRPYHCLSNGEKFRTTLARALVENQNGLIVFDEFTSVVNRTVARIGSAAVAKTVRREDMSFVAVTCHNDVEEWLQPDWKYDTTNGVFTWRLLQRRPQIKLTIRQAQRSEWEIFRRHHYLNENLSGASQCFVGTVDDQPVTFTAVLFFPHATASGWREHRTVCLPDFQGVGLGNAMSEFIAGMYATTGRPYYSVTSHPAMILHRAKSKLWNMHRVPSRVGNLGTTSSLRRVGKNFQKGGVQVLPSGKTFTSSGRNTAGFSYVGPKLWVEAKRFGIVSSGKIA